MVKAKLTWKTMKSPETTQQTITYMNTCQTWFAEVTEPNVISQENVIRLQETSTKLQLQNIFHMADQFLIAGNESNASCFKCQINNKIGNMSIEVVNPFSDTKILVCPACAN